MCGRYYVDNEEENVKLRAILQELDRRRYPMDAQVKLGEVFPGQVAPVIIADEGKAAVRGMRWGFPRAGGGGLVINSRSEKADVTPMFSRAARERRCLVPMTAFYEWRRTESGAKTKEKFIFRSEPAGSGRLMYLAGFWGAFLGGSAEGGFEGFAILTQEADDQMRPYHHRMPVILTSEAVKKNWLFTPPVVPYTDLMRQFQTPQLCIMPA